MPGNVLGHNHVNLDEGCVRDGPAGGGDVPARTASRGVLRSGYTRQRQPRENGGRIIDHAGRGYSRQPQDRRLAQGKVIVTVTVTKIVSNERAKEYVGLGWFVVGASDAGTTIRWVGGEHDRTPEPKTDWDRMWSQPFDRPELVGENGNPS